jgi:hypothetical protein
VLGAEEVGLGVVVGVVMMKAHVDGAEQVKGVVSEVVRMMR